MAQKNKKRTKKAFGNLGCFLFYHREHSLKGIEVVIKFVPIGDRNFFHPFDLRLDILNLLFLGILGIQDIGLKVGIKGDRFLEDGRLLVDLLGFRLFFRLLL